MTADIPKRYSIDEQETQWRDFWQKQALFRFSVDETKEPFVVDTPPPTVSGRMHAGHAFSYAQQDFMVRYKRMRGYNVFYPFGTDDNGLPTERLVEKLKNVRSTHMDRQKFVDLCHATVTEIKPDFVDDWVRLGMSCDFEGSYSTIDKQCIAVSQAAFLDMFAKGKVYQEEAPVSWCPHCQTAIAQAEFDSVDKKSHFNHIVFTVGGKELIIATTRPELLPSCVAVFVHPEDKRFADIVGKHAKVPLFDYEVPILADPHADPEKGTGTVMCCTFGDKVDVEWWKTHKLPLKISIEKDGKMNAYAGPYAGLPVKEARKQIIADLKEKGLLIRQEEITHPVNTHERCGTDIELLKTKQWFVRVLDNKEGLIEAGERINWYPEYMKKRYIHWVQNLNWDWCISRQRHYGVPFPVWKEKDTGKIIVAKQEQLPCDPLKDTPLGYKGDVKNLAPETDIMDTWATSSCTPQIICNWEFKGQYNGDMSLYPTQLRVQAHDIIRTWAFYTIVKGLYVNNDIPWKDIVISGHILDPLGKKMSKSKGNIIDPRVILKDFGADALRYWASSAKLGDDLPFQEKDLHTGKKTVNKLWNASKFVHMHIAEYAVQNKGELRPIDHWLLAKMNSAVSKATQSFDVYEFSKARHSADQFFWRVLCDNYLEIIKDRLYREDAFGKDAQLGAKYCLHHAINTSLRLYAPFMPFITESCYHYFFKGDAKSIHISSWPTAVADVDEQFVAGGDACIDVLALLRSEKNKQGLSLNAELVTVTVTHPTPELLEPFVDDLKSAVKAENMTVTKGELSIAITAKKKE